MLIVNGRIFGASKAATALAIDGDRIAGIGTDEEIRGLARPGRRVIDAHGGLVVPGFNDAHVHLHNGSRQLPNLDLTGEISLDGVVARIASFSKQHPDRAWVLGRGWIYATFPGGYPDRSILDRILPDRPAAFESWDVHTTWLNSMALARLGITNDTPNPPGGEIMRDAGGQATGVLKETAMELLDAALPPLSPSEELELLEQSTELAARHGLTSVQDAAAPAAAFEVMRRLREQGRPKLRARLARSMDPGQSMAAWEKRLIAYEEEIAPFRTDSWLRGGILKAFMDGVVETRTAAMLEPYDDIKERGALRWEPDEFQAAVSIADRRGWQVETHAIGDRAVRTALDAYDAVARINGARDRRHRIEHIEVADPVDVTRFGSLGVIASMQPYHADPTDVQFESWANPIGAERAAHGWSWGSIERAGGRLAFGSDWPVVSLDPLLGLNMAVNRTTADGEPPGGWIPTERIAMAQALEAYTSGAAYAEFTEAEKGALGPGMLADITIFDRDLLAIPSHEVLSAQVVFTIVGGLISFERD